MFNGQIEAFVGDRSVKVKVNMKCEDKYMDYISIAAPKGKTNYGGLCGKVTKIGKEECGFTSNSNTCVKNSEQLAKYWK